MHDDEVQVGCAVRLLVTAGFLAGAAGELVDGRIEPPLRHLDDFCEAGQDLAALGGVQVRDHAVQRRRDVQVPVAFRDLILTHGGGGGAQRGNDSRAVGQGLFLLADAGLGAVGRKPESVDLRADLRADELRRQAAEGDARSLQIVHGIDPEHAAAVKVALDRLIFQGHIALHIAAVTAVVGQALHIHHGDDQLVGVGALLHQLRRAVQVASQHLAGIDLIQQRHIALCQFDCICHRFFPPYFWSAALSGRPIARRMATLQLFDWRTAAVPVPAA